MTPDEEVAELLEELKQIVGEQPNHPYLVADDIIDLTAEICELLPRCSRETRYEYNRYGLYAGMTHPLLLAS